ncbi:MAG TPA: translesion error-prone DNA polymerase V autoproteolytic subunit [Thermodesulfobacteriota bacterium]|nr:translesion error-prone DNA polymerase V autoproteolytic subunit [Thermodesulfobacteriota bacterium]
MTVTEMYRLKSEVKLNLPLFLVRPPAGFPSPADDYIEERIDLNKKLVKHPEATYLVRVMGNSMVEARIDDGDFLLVDRAIEAKTNDIILAVLNGDFTVKRLVKKADRWYLVSANPKYLPIEISSEADFEIWGKVTYIFHPAL